MSSKPAPRATNGAASVIVTADIVREECTFMIRKIPVLIAPEVTSRKKQYAIIAKMTGIKPRRVKDYWRGEVNDPPGSQDRTIRNAYRAALLRWKESALSRLEEIEAENEENIRAVVSYSSERWQRVSGAGTEPGALGTKAAAVDTD